MALNMGTSIQEMSVRDKGRVLGFLEYQVAETILTAGAGKAIQAGKLAEILPSLASKMKKLEKLGVKPEVIDRLVVSLEKLGKAPGGVAGSPLTPAQTLRYRNMTVEVIQPGTGNYGVVQVFGGRYMHPTRELVQEAEFTCGPFSVGRMLDHYNPRRAGTVIGDEGVLSLKFPTGQAGEAMHMYDVNVLLRSNMPAGVRAESMSFADAMATNKSFLVAVREGKGYHAVVVEAVENGGKTLRIYDPGIGVVRVNTIEFNKIVASSPEDFVTLGKYLPAIGVK